MSKSTARHATPIRLRPLVVKLKISLVFLNLVTTTRFDGKVTENLPILCHLHLLSSMSLAGYCFVPVLSCGLGMRIFFWWGAQNLRQRNVAKTACKG